jgi:hypothetical protein
LSPQINNNIVVGLVYYSVSVFFLLFIPALIKILAYLGDQLQTLNRTDIKKQELAEVCGYMKTGSHGFSYAYKDLVDEGMIHKGKLTELGISSLPSEVVSFQ